MSAKALSMRASSFTITAPSGVSINTTTSSGARSRICCGSSVLASITVVYAVLASASRSGAWSVVASGLILTTVRPGSNGFSISAARASSRSFAATPSSRSRITTSAAAAAFPKRSGRSAGQNNQPGPLLARVISLLACAAPLCVSLRPLAHHRFSRCGRHDVAVLVAPGVGEGDDALPRTTLGLALVGHLGLGVERVAVKERLRERDLAEAEVADDRALGQLRHRQSDECRQREHRVHQALVERRQRI